MNAMVLHHERHYFANQFVYMIHIRIFCAFLRKIRNLSHSFTKNTKQSEDMFEIVNTTDIDVYALVRIGSRIVPSHWFMENHNVGIALADQISIKIPNRLMA